MEISLVEMGFDLNEQMLLCCSPCFVSHVLIIHGHIIHVILYEEVLDIQGVKLFLCVRFQIL